MHPREGKKRFSRNKKEISKSNKEEPVKIKLSIKKFIINSRYIVLQIKLKTCINNFSIRTNFIYKRRAVPYFLLK